MRDRIWTNLSNVKFKATYTGHVSRRSYHVGNAYSFMLAFASASSVAAWAIWDIYPLIWTAIVGFSQVLHVAKPYIPFIKNDREFIEQSLLFESLYLSYEKLWFDHAKGGMNEELIENKFYSLRQKEHDIAKKFKHIICPVHKGLISKADNETDKFLRTNY